MSDCSNAGQPFPEAHGEEYILEPQGDYNTREKKSTIRPSSSTITKGNLWCFHQFVAEKGIFGRACFLRWQVGVAARGTSVDSKQLIRGRKYLALPTRTGETSRGPVGQMDSAGPAVFCSSTRPRQLSCVVAAAARSTCRVF
jgi:hypothetical protein